MKAVVLAGGFATRLRPLSCTRPKILFPIVNKPLLQWTFERLAQNNVKDVILAVFYQTETYIKQHKVPRNGLHITYSHDPLTKPLGTGGAIKKAEKHLGHNEPFLVLNGDIFADINHTEMLKQHEERNAPATIALHEVEDPSRYGVAKLSKDGHITSFIEKPQPGKAPSNLINAGAYILSPKILEYIPEGRQVSIEREIFPTLAKERKLFGYAFKGLWTDIGKPVDYLELNKTMLKAGVKQGTHDTKVKAEIRKPVAFDLGISIGNRSIIGPYVVLGKNAVIGENVHVRNSVILPGTTVSDSVSIDGAIIGEGVAIGRSAAITKGCIIGDHSRIGDHVKLREGTTVCPATEVN